MLLATLVAPALVQVGVDKMAAHLFVLYFGLMSMITPPIAIAAFAAATLAGANPMRTGFAAVRFGWLAYLIPFLFIASPALLLKGGMTEIALAIASGRCRRVAGFGRCGRLPGEEHWLASACGLFVRRSGIVGAIRHRGRTHRRYRRPFH